MIAMFNSKRIGLALLFCAIGAPIFTQTFTPGVPVFDSTEYVEYIPGNLPVVISVPHGGDLEPANIPDRDCDNFVCVKDAYTQELGRSIGAAFYEQTGCYPHLIINLLHRKKFDANREIMEAADGHPVVEQSWYGYHAFIDSAKQRIVQDFGRGLFLDLHGHGHSIQRIELGYRLSKSNLQLSDNELNGDFYIEKSSLQTLVNDNLLALTHAQLLRGPYSFGTLLEATDVPAVPSSPDPFPLDDESYFSGGYNTGRHGSTSGGNIDGIQIECHQSIRFDTNLRESFADSLTSIINAFIQLHYNDQYTGNYCNLLVPTSKPVLPAAVKIFPNPINDYLYLESPFDAIELCIYNSLGQRVLSEIWHGTAIDLRMLNEGIYFIELKIEGEIWETQKLIKQD